AGSIDGGLRARRSTPMPEWPEDERLRYAKETLGFYITGHPLNKFSEELRLFSNASTETLYKHVDEVVNIGGIVSQIKKSKIKKGPNEGKMMAKFFLDDQYGSVEVVVFSDLFAKYMRWLDNGVAVLVTATVKDTGGQQAGRSASLQSAEQAAQHIDDEYGGHPESRGARISAYELRLDDAEDDRDPKEVEREKYGDRKDNMALFGGAPASDIDAFNDAVDSIEESPAVAPAAGSGFASHAAAFHESPVTPDLSALEIVQLDGIRDKKVKEIALEVPYPRMTEETVKKIREIVEEHAGEIPVTVTIVELPEELAATTGAPQLRMKVNHHFRVTPGTALSDALARANANVRYVF
ncbi:MAG: OB-fold nucleic acid binding domain-containing protein, partial [Thermoanaerobaculia bacterium]